MTNQFSRQQPRLRPRRLTALVAPLAALLVLAGCSDASQAAETEVVGIWGQPDQADSPYVSLGEDGTLTGSDGCNRMVGDWQQEGDVISFSPVATTLMFCEGVDTTISRMHSGELDGEFLEFKDEDGEIVATLSRTSQTPESLAD